MPRKKHLINVHTGTGTTAPSGADLYLGEIAVQHTSGSPALWVKVGASEESDSYEKFIGETEIREIVNNSNILGSGYTYTGIPYVNSATAIADAYSALTYEILDNETVIATALNNLNNKVAEMSGNTPDVTPLSAAVISLSAGVKVNEYVAASAINYLNDRINELSGNTGGGADVQPLSGAVLSLSAAVVTISGNSGSGGDIQPLSSATSSHISNNNIHVTSADKTAWTNGANSGASAYTAITELSAATVAHEGNANVHVPTGGTNGQILSVVNGSPAWTNPLTVYTGTLPPEQTLGISGDLYIRTDN